MARLDGSEYRVLGNLHPAGPPGIGYQRERGEAIGAAFEIESQVGQGTQVVVWEDRTGRPGVEQ